MTISLTENMSKFIEANEVSPIISGDRLTSKGLEILTASDLDDSNQIRYTLKNGMEFIISASDALSAPTYSPKWDI